MNLFKAMLHPGALRHRTYVVRDRATGRDLGEPKPLNIGAELEIDFDTFPDNVDIIISPAAPSTVSSAEPSLDHAQGSNEPTADAALQQTGPGSEAATEVQLPAEGVVGEDPKPEVEEKVEEDKPAEDQPA